MNIKSILSLFLVAVMVLSVGSAAGAASVGSSNVQEDASASVQFSDQETDGTTVVVDSVELSEGGFVTIHDSSLLEGNVLGSVVGVSAYLEAGTHEDVEIQLFTGVEGAEFDVSELQENETLIAMPHLDTNDNQTYDFVSTEGGADGPYIGEDNQPVTDDAEVTVMQDGHDCPCPDDDNVTDDNVTDDNITDDNVTDDNVTDDNATDEPPVDDDNVTDDEPVDNVTDDNVTDDNVTGDDDVTDAPPTDGDEVDAEQRAFQIDFAFGETIQQLGADDDAFYAEQDNRLIQAVSVTEDGEMTEAVRHQSGERESPHSDATVSFDVVEFDAETQEATVHVSVSEDSSEDVTLTLAAYEFPDGQTTFSFDTADQQELVADQTVTLEPGEETTLTVQIDGEMGDDVPADEPADGDNVTDDTPPADDDNVTDEPVDDNVTDEPVDDDNVTDDNVTDAPPADDDDDGTDEGASGDSDDASAVDELPLEVVDMDVSTGFDQDSEYIVLRNVGEEDVDLSGLTVTDRADGGTGMSHTFTSGTTLAPEEEIRIVTGSGDDEGTVYMGYERVMWNQDGDIVRVVDADGNELFTQAYGDQVDEDANSISVSTAHLAVA